MWRRSEPISDGHHPTRLTRWAAAVGLAGVVLLAACGDAAGPATTSGQPTAAEPVASALVVDGPGRYEGELVSGGVVRRFVVVVPESVPSPAPLVIVLHGFMGNPAEVERDTGMSEVAQVGGFVVAYPEGEGLPRSWRSDPRRGDSDVIFIRHLVALLDEAVGIDGERVYAAGMSNGGGMAARLACDAADLMAAVGGVAGAYFLGDCAAVRPVGVIFFHGDADPIVPYEGWGRFLPPIEEWAAGWAARNGCVSAPLVQQVTADVSLLAWTDCADGADVALYTVADGRHGWPGSPRAGAALRSTDSVNASQMLWDFFAAHPRT